MVCWHVANSWAGARAQLHARSRQQQPSPREGHELLAQLVAAGEGVFDINIPAASVERIKERGAPIDWTALAPVPSTMVVPVSPLKAASPMPREFFWTFFFVARGTKTHADAWADVCPRRFYQRASLHVERAQDRSGPSVAGRKTRRLRETAQIDLSAKITVTVA